MTFYKDYRFFKLHRLNGTKWWHIEQEPYGLMASSSFRLPAYLDLVSCR